MGVSYSFPLKITLYLYEHLHLTYIKNTFKQIPILLSTSLSWSSFLQQAEISEENPKAAEGGKPTTADTKGNQNWGVPSPLQLRNSRKWDSMGM